MSLKERVIDLKHEMLCERTRRRQRAAKDEFDRRGVKPRIVIGSGYVPPCVARVFTHMNVRGLA